MADNINEPDFHSDLEKILGSGGSKKDFGLSPFFKPGVFIFLTALAWLIIISLYASYINYYNKYDKVLNNLNFKLKTDTAKLNKIKTNLVFFRKVARNQVNVSYLLYLLSLRRFGDTYIKSLSVNNGRVNISVFSLENGFARSLNLMNDYTLYLNIYGLQMHTGRFRIASIIEKEKGKNRSIIGGISSGRFRYRINNQQ
jgi:hypothetical protein